MCLSGLKLLLQGSSYTNVYVHVVNNECMVYVWSSIKTYRSKVMMRNTFHGDPRSSLWKRDCRIVGIFQGVKVLCMDAKSIVCVYGKNFVESPHSINGTLTSK